jgi:hypothetical protein
VALPEDISNSADREVSRCALIRMPRTNFWPDVKSRSGWVSVGKRILLRTAWRTWARFVPEGAWPAGRLAGSDSRTRFGFADDTLMVRRTHI